MKRRRTRSKRLLAAVFAGVITIVFGIAVSLVAGFEPTPTHAVAMLSLVVLSGFVGWTLPGPFLSAFEFLERLWSPWW